MGMYKLEPANLNLLFADKSIKKPEGIITNVLVQVKHVYIPTYFVVMDYEEDEDIPILLGQPFLNTADVRMRMWMGLVKLKVGEEKIVIDATPYSKSHHIDEVQEISCEPSVGEMIGQEKKCKAMGHEGVNAHDEGLGPLGVQPKHQALTKTKAKKKKKKNVGKEFKASKRRTRT